MAKRRMFSTAVTNDETFTDMPLSSQALYFHLSLAADDDGFIENARWVMRGIGANDDDMRVLIAKGFVIEFGPKVLVIRDWKIANRGFGTIHYSPTKHVQELETLAQDETGRYYRTDTNEAINYVVSGGTLYPVRITTEDGTRIALTINPQKSTRHQARPYSINDLQAMSSQLPHHELTMSNELNEMKLNEMKLNPTAPANSSMNIYSESNPSDQEQGGGSSVNAITKLRDEWQANAGVWSDVLKTDLLADMHELQTDYGLSEADSLALLQTAIQETARSANKGVPIPALLNKVVSRYEDTGTLTPAAVAAHELQRERAAKPSPSGGYSKPEDIRNAVYHDSVWDEIDARYAAEDAAKAKADQQSGGDGNG